MRAARAAVQSCLDGVGSAGEHEGIAELRQRTGLQRVSRGQGATVGD